VGLELAVCEAAVLLLLWIVVYFLVLLLLYPSSLGLLLAQDSVTPHHHHAYPSLNRKTSCHKKGNGKKPNGHQNSLYANLPLSGRQDDALVQGTLVDTENLVQERMDDFLWRGGDASVLVKHYTLLDAAETNNRS
jgi:hypothetical protein